MDFCDRQISDEDFPQSARISGPLLRLSVERPSRTRYLTLAELFELVLEFGVSYFSDPLKYDIPHFHAD